MMLLARDLLSLVHIKFQVHMKSYSHILAAKILDSLANPKLFTRFPGKIAVPLHTFHLKRVINFEKLGR